MSKISSKPHIVYSIIIRTKIYVTYTESWRNVENTAFVTHKPFKIKKEEIALCTVRLLLYWRHKLAALPLKNFSFLHSKGWQIRVCWIQGTHTHTAGCALYTLLQDILSQIQSLCFFVFLIFYKLNVKTFLFVYPLYHLCSL